MWNSDIVGTLWQVTRTQGTLLWKRVFEGTLSSVSNLLLPIGSVFIVLEEDDYGNVRILTRFGVFWNSYQNLKKAAEQL